MEPILVSLVTTCMGRLADLRQTLPDNLANADHPWVEWVLLDYNSRDGLGDWVRDNLGQYLASGRLVYARTDEPQFYSMAHSRNVAMLIASGQTVHNIDADNRTGPGFVEWVRGAMGRVPRKAIFTKSRRLMRGRIGFWRDEFINDLGGYDEGLRGYGHDDRDICNRAQALGYHTEYFGGWCERLHTSRAQKVENMPPDCKSWKASEEINKAKSAANLAAGKFRANAENDWGRATVSINFAGCFTTNPHHGIAR